MSPVAQGKLGLAGTCVLLMITTFASQALGYVTSCAGTLGMEAVFPMADQIKQSQPKSAHPRPSSHFKVGTL